jgi:hypothetical protein
MNRLGIIRMDLNDEKLLKTCNLGKGAKTCPFLSLHTAPHQKSNLECLNFSKKGIQINKQVRAKTAYTKKYGCFHVLEKFIEITNMKLAKGPLLVEYVDQPNDEEKFLVDIVFETEKENISIRVITKRDNLPFPISSIHPEHASFSETEKYFLISSEIGFNFISIKIYK